MVNGDLVFCLEHPRRGCHAVMGGAQDVQLINRGGIHFHLRPQHGGISDQLIIKFLTFFGRKFF